MDLKSLGSIQLKKIMRHMSHTSQIWFCLYYCITEIVDILATAVSNLKNCLLVEKKWGNLSWFEVSVVKKVMRHKSHTSQIWFCLIIAILPIDRWYLYNCNNFKNFLLVVEKWDNLSGFEVLCGQDMSKRSWDICLTRLRFDFVSLFSTDR